MSGSETISSTGRARAASDLTAERARTAATVGDHAGRTVRAGSIRAASLGRSVRSQSIGTVPAGVRQATAPGIGPDAGHIYESLDAASDERRGTPTVRPAATSSARGPEYSALHPPQLPARPAGGFLRRAVQPDTAPPGQLGISVRAGRQAPSANEAGARLVQTAASNPGPGRLGEYETPMPSSDSGLERFSGYLVNMLEEGRIPRSMQGDLESALLFAGRLDSDLARGVQLSGGSAAGQPPAGEERLSSVTARNAGEVGRTLTLLDGCLARNDATPEARALIRGLRARIAERHSALVELVLRNAETARPSRPSVEAGTRSAGNRAHTGGPLAGFVGGAARSRRADAQLTVAADGQVAVRKGLFSQWRGQRQTEANRATASSFLAALRETYGKEVADIAGSSDGVQRALTRGRALQAKDVDAAVQRANTLATQYRAETDRLATMYVTPEESSGVSLTKIKIDDVARRLPAGHGPRGTAALVDAHAVGERVAAAIRSKGDGGKHLVTTEEARGILDTVVRDELMGAYNAARIEVMAQLSPEDPESLLRRSLETAVAERGLALQPERLGSGACDVLQRRADAAVRSLDAGAVGDQAETQRIADELAADFAAERAEAEAALDESGLSGPALDRIADQIRHDETPAALVPQLAAAYVAVEADVRKLGQPMDATELAPVLVNLSDAVTQSVTEAGVVLGPENQNRVYAQCLRFLLAPGGRAGYEAVAQQFEPGNTLREASEGLGWIRRRFTLTDEAIARATFDEQGEMEIDGKPLWKVAEYHSLTENLSNVLTEALGRPGEIEDPDSLAALRPEIVGLLQRLDVPLPGEYAGEQA